MPTTSNIRWIVYPLENTVLPLNDRCPVVVLCFGKIKQLPASSSMGFWGSLVKLYHSKLSPQLHQRFIHGRVMDSSIQAIKLIDHYSYDRKVLPKCPIELGFRG